METLPSNLTILSHLGQWNSQAVALLDQGDVAGSIKLLKHVLSCLRDTLPPQAEHRPQGHQRDTEMSDADSNDSSSICSVPLFLPSALCWAGETSLLSFYPRAFVFQGVGAGNASSTSSPFAKPDGCCHSQMILVVLYNLALACHIDAARRQQAGHSHRTALEAAKGFYKAALDVTSSCWDDDDFDRSEWLVLATLNNSGCIASDQMDFHRAQTSIQMMVELISFDPETLRIPDDDIELFYDSLYTYLDGTQLSIAPAA